MSCGPNFPHPSVRWSAGPDLPLCQTKSAHRLSTLATPEGRALETRGLIRGRGETRCHRAGLQQHEQLD